MDIDLTGLDGAMAQRSFTGVIAAHADRRRVAERCAGYRHRAHRVPMTVDTRIAYAMGFWVHPTRDVLILEGYDAGASFRSSHAPVHGLTLSVLGNSSEGAWPVIGAVAGLLDAALQHADEVGDPPSGADVDRPR